MNIPIRQYWNLLVNYLRAQRGRVFLLGLLLLSTIGLQLVSPQLVGEFVDEAQTGGAMNTLLTLALLYIGIALVQQVAAIGTAYLSENVGWTATNALRADLARHSLRLDMSFHNTHTPGEMIERIDGDVTMLATFFSQFVLVVLSNLLLIVGVLVILFREDWRLGVAMTLFVVAALVLLHRTRNLAAPHWAAGREASADLSGFVEERFAGIDDIRSNGATAYKMNLLHALSRKLLLRYRKAWLIGEVGTVSAQLMFGLALAVGLGVGAFLFYRGVLTTGTVLMVSIYAGYIARPLGRLTEQVQELQKAGGSIERLRELQEVQSVIVDGPSPLVLSGAPSVEFEGVFFEYNAGEPVLEGVSFRLERGKVLGLLGRTGSGKTTTTRLLFRLYDPTAGTIWLDGTDIRTVRLADLRRQIGVVTQDVQLFRATVRDNLTFFDPTIRDERILEAFAALGLSAWYESLPQGLDTSLAAGGGGLSAGEAQLLAFTRIFLKDPHLVIMDEASSRLDPATENLIERAVDRLLAGRTAIIIAHRLGTVQRADEIVILDSGRIVEHGPRERLAADPTARFYHLLRVGLEEVLA